MTETTIEERLATYLGVDADTIEPTAVAHGFVVNPHTVRRGSSNHRAAGLVRTTTEALRVCKEMPPRPGKGPAVSLVCPSLETLRKIGYNRLHARLREANPDALGIGLHDVLNTLYFLIDDSSDRTVGHREALTDAWLRATTEPDRPMVDRTRTVTTFDSEWIACSEADADLLWDDALDSYLDDCVLPELDDSVAKYFDRNAWKRDARQDGRGHALSGYDGEEHDIGGGFIAFRIN